MQDEADTELSAVINQMTFGHEFLLREFGVKPQIGWHIDPFGASSVTPTLWALTGFKAFVINRMDFRLKAEWIKDRALEFVWRGSNSLGEKVEMFTHVLDNHYCSPMGLDGWEHGVSQNLPQGDGPPLPVVHPPSYITRVNVSTIGLRALTALAESTANK